MRNKISKSQTPTAPTSPWEWRKRLSYAVLGSFTLSDDLPEEVPTDFVYSAFSTIKPRYPNWLGSLHFETYRSATTCKNLEDILFSLGAFGLVTVENRDFKYLRFSVQDKKVTKDKINKRMVKDGSLKDLKDLSNDFAKSIASQIKASTK